MPVGAMLASLAARLDPSRRLVIHALADRLPEETWRRLTGSVPGDRSEWHRFDLDSLDLVRRGFCTRRYGHIPPVTYLRLLLPELLPDRLEKVLYLDGDLLVREDIAPLWDTEIATVDFAAVPDRDLTGRLLRVRRNLPRYRDLGMDPDRPVFNMGVMLINLERWRARQVSARAFGVVRCLGTETLWYEQDALNVVGEGYCRELPPRWNARPSDSPGASTACIVHFLTGTKPWHWNYTGPYREEYFEAIDQTRWAGWRPERLGFATARLLLARVPRALSKGADAVRRRTARLKHRLAYHRGHPGQPFRRVAGTSIPPGRGEIRFFLRLQGSIPNLAAVLDGYAAAGVDRAFLLDSPGDENDPDLSTPAIPVHRFRCASDHSGLALRRLLDRHGRDHWCVLGQDAQLLREDDGTRLDLRRLVARLEQERAGLVLAVTGAGQETELVGRDLRTGCLFRSPAVARFEARAWEPPKILSDPAVFRYQRSLCLDVDLKLAGKVRRSARRLLRVPLEHRAAP